MDISCYYNTMWTTPNKRHKIDSGGRLYLRRRPTTMIYDCNSLLIGREGWPP